MSPSPMQPKPSCATCPSFIAANDSSFFKKSIGVPMCARFGKPMGKLTSTPAEIKAIQRSFAASCGAHGQPRPSAPDYSKLDLYVVTPDVNALGHAPNMPERVNSCGGCQHFVRDRTVANDLGWAAPICRAKGKILFPNRLTLEARACGLRSLGTSSPDTSSLHYLPAYEPGFAGDADPVKARAQMSNADPTEYETDSPVSASDDAQGIRAWREIGDPITGNSVLLPIYKREIFTPEEQALIPSKGDDEHPEDYVDHNFYVYKVAVLWTQLDETPAFWGKAGTGKTEFYRHMAYLMQLPFHRFSITGSTEVDELVGSMQYDAERGTFFEKGLFVKAWERPCVMVVDELNLGRPDVQQILRPCIDNSKQLVLTMAPGAPRVERSLDTYLGVAMNPAWDVLNVGAQPIGDADANRLMHLYVELPPEKLEREIITTRCAHDGWEIPKDVLDFVMNVANEIRALVDDQKALPISWAIRPQLKVARALRWFDPITAYRMASADYLEPEQQAMLLDIVKANAGE